MKRTAATVWVRRHGEKYGEMSYGFASNLRDALPNASFIAFTGTPIEKTDANTAISRTEREIALMQEYRTRLTADLVTGKLDVREAATKLPEVAAEPAAQNRPPILGLRFAAFHPLRFRAA